MGIAGTMGFFMRNKRHFNSPMVLRNTRVVIDVTKGFYWPVKKRIFENRESSGHRMDQFGTSMIELGNYYRNLFKRLRDRNCTLILVYDGYPLDETQHGCLASKGQFMRGSCQAAMRRLERGQVGGDLPELANNCVKEIVNEFQLGPEQLYQAAHEVYPLLERLARKFDCPVMTSHSDFIFSDVPKGFIWLEEIEIPTDVQSPWYCPVYFHDAMLRHFNLDERHSPAVNCLRVLMRDDFRDAHANAVNAILNLGNQRRGQKTNQLCNLMEKWPRQLDSVSAVRNALRSKQSGGGGGGGGNLMRDFDAIHESFTVAHEFGSSDLARAMSASQDRLVDAQDALLQRESSAEFLGTLRAKSIEYRRTSFQDIKTFRSTFSLCDRVKQYLAERLHASDVHLYDRQRDVMLERPLSGAPNQVAGLLQARLTLDVLFTLFHFSEHARQALAERLSNSLQLDIENANRLALLLLLARHSLKLVPRESYDNTDHQMAGPPSRTRSSNSNTTTIDPLRPAAGSPQQTPPRSPPRRSPPVPVAPVLEGPMAQRYHNLEMRRKYFTAILNSFVYHLGRQHQGDESSRDVPADIRVARQKIEMLASRAPSCDARASSAEYVACKHLVEALNSTLHGYKELNSLYNFVGPNILVNKFYDGVLIYKLMSSMSKTLAGYLLQLDAELEGELFDF